MLIRPLKIDPSDFSRQFEAIKNLDLQIDHILPILESKISHNKLLGLSLINNELIHLYNDLLTSSYIIKLWIIDYHKEQKNPVPYRRNLLGQSSVRQIETARQLIIRFRKSQPAVSRRIHYQRLANKAV